MSRVIIVEPDITDEENQSNWEKINDVINAIADELEIEMFRKKCANG